jgi:hypothetical protein
MKPLERRRCRWEDSIKIGLQVECGVIDWTALVYYTDRWRALVNAVLNLWVS